MKLRRFRPWIFGLCAVSLFISWLTLSCAAADVDTRTYVKRASGGLLDAWVPPMLGFVGENPDPPMFYSNYPEPLYVNFETVASSSAPLAVRFFGDYSDKTSALLTGYFTYPFAFYPITSDLPQSELLSAALQTGTLSFTFNIEFFGGDDTFHPATNFVVPVFGTKFAYKSHLGDLYRYTLFLDNSSDTVNAVLSALYNNQVFQMRFALEFTKAFSATAYFSPLLISTNPAGPGILSSDAEIIVEGLEHLEEAVKTAIQSGVTDVSRVIVQETTKVTDKLDEVTQTIINVGSDIDMSVDTSKLTSAQERSDALTAEIYSKIDSGEVETVITRRLSDPVSDSYNHAGFQLVGGWMQRIFDMGFGTIIFMCLTLGVSLFIIGRRM